MRVSDILASPDKENNSPRSSIGSGGASSPEELMDSKKSVRGAAAAPAQKRRSSGDGHNEVDDLRGSNKKVCAYTFMLGVLCTAMSVVCVQHTKTNYSLLCSLYRPRRSLLQWSQQSSQVVLRVVAPPPRLQSACALVSVENNKNVRARVRVHAAASQFSSYYRISAFKIFHIILYACCRHIFTLFLYIEPF